MDREHRVEPELPAYMRVCREDCVLHLSEHFGDGTPGACLFLPMQGVREYQALLTDICDQPWGWTERSPRSWSIRDPLGNKLRFSERERWPESLGALAFRLELEILASSTGSVGFTAWIGCSGSRGYRPGRTRRTPHLGRRRLGAEGGGRSMAALAPSTKRVQRRKG